MLHTLKQEERLARAQHGKGEFSGVPDQSEHRLMYDMYYVHIQAPYRAHGVLFFTIYSGIRMYYIRYPIGICMQTHTKQKKGYTHVKLHEVPRPHRCWNHDRCTGH
jgi:hypothetical protein